MALELNKTTLSLEVGNSETLVATPSEGVTWTSSAESVATVSEGTVTAVSEGKATITATVGEDTATCSVTVTPAEDLLHDELGAYLPNVHLNIPGANGLIKKLNDINDYPYSYEEKE